MTLYERTLVELRARLASIPALGAAGVMRGDTFTPEREQLDGAAIDIADGTLTLSKKRNDCEWQLTADPQVRITALTEAERDRVLDLAIGELAAPWPMPRTQVHLNTAQYRRGGADRTAFTVVISLDVSLVSVAFNLSQSPD